MLLLNIGHIKEHVNDARNNVSEMTKNTVLLILDTGAKADN